MDAQAADTRGTGRLIRQDRLAFVDALVLEILRLRGPRRSHRVTGGFNSAREQDVMCATSTSGASIVAGLGLQLGGRLGEEHRIATVR